MQILERNYDLKVSEIKGFEKLSAGQAAHIDKCKLTRYIVVLDKSQYIINAEDYPEMTQAAQEEYDDFISKIRQEISMDEIRVLDEGYGIDEDELEWHITGCVTDKENDEIVGIIEIDTCVRIDEIDE